MVVAIDIDQVLARAVGAGDVPGVVALAADKRGVLYQGAFGTHQFGHDTIMPLNAVMAIASMTKAVTAVAAMQLVEQGRLVLDQPVSDHLSDLAAVQVLDGFNADGSPRMRPQRRAITLRHLLTHTAGFAYATWNADLLRFQQHAGGSLPPLQAPLVFDAGDRWEYGISIDWVGRLIEHVSGQTLEDYFREHILDPLGMVDTGFILGPNQRARLASRFQRQPDGSLSVIEVDIPARPAVFNGGGGLFSTGPDYLRFLRMLLGDGHLDGARVLRPETVTTMAQNHIGDLTVGVLPSFAPTGSNDAEFFPGMIKKWGLGGVINTVDAPTGRSAGSWTWAGYFNTYFWIDPPRGVAGLLLTQILPFCDTVVLDLFADFERGVYASRG